MVDSMFKDRFKCRKKGHSVVLQDTCPFNKCNTVDMIGKKKKEVEMMSIQFVTDSDFQTTT